MSDTIPVYAHIVSTYISLLMGGDFEENEYTANDDNEDEVIDEPPVEAITWKNAAVWLWKYIADIWEQTISISNSSNVEILLLQKNCLKAVSRLYAPSLLVISPFQLIELLLPFFSHTSTSYFQSCTTTDVTDMYCATLCHIYSEHSNSWGSTGPDDEYIIRASLLSKVKNNI